MNADVKFFYTNAGYSFDPKKETAEQGRERCAINLAAAEGIARNAGVSFAWSRDIECSAEDQCEEWQCLAYDAAGNVCGSLGAVDFGPDAGPYSSDYRRVVEAEIASECLDTILQSNEEG